MLSKIATFILSSKLILRDAKSRDVGFANVTLGLVKATVLALSREAPRAVALRAAQGGGGGALSRQRFANLAWLPVPAGLLLALLCALAPRALGEPLSAAQAAAWALTCAAAALEALAEPAFI